ncbi:MAG: nucleotide exchange factor GrpE [Candidatus Aenigmatarchaeota archaeon]|nr:MAG: nucleotide exchange factor GrpE [Candidatus Aenigmarchaeota archaeon]
MKNKDKSSGSKESGKSNVDRKRGAKHESLKQLEEKARLADERLNQIKYLQADFENYKKSIERRNKDFEQKANERLVKELLPVIDDLEAAAQKAGNDEARKGYELIYKKVIDILMKSGLSVIQAKGKQFDPYFHEAVTSVPSDQPEGTVLEEVQKGYTFHSDVIRHSKVKVAKKRDKK